MKTNLKRELRKIEVASSYIYHHIEDHCTEQRFNRLFQLLFDRNRQIKSALVQLIQYPSVPTRRLIELYNYTEIDKDWQKKVELALKSKEPSDPFARKFLSLSQTDKEDYLFHKKERKDYFNTIKNDILYSKVGLYLIRKLYSFTTTLEEKFRHECFWMACDFGYEKKETSQEVNERLDYCIKIFEDACIEVNLCREIMTPSYLISVSNYLTRYLEDTFWLLNTFVYLRPYVQSYHVKLLYDTYVPNTSSYGYPVQGMAYFGKTDLECRKLAYEGLDKMPNPLFRQDTIENMKDWYNDFPEDLYEKYTNEYKEFEILLEKSRHQ